MSGLHHLLIWFDDPANWRGTNGVPTRVGEHLWLWAWSMAIAIAIGVPGGLLLAVPPIFTFTFTAVRQVDPATVESARGMGMTESRILRSVQIPLSLPLILNGIRLSSAAVIATAPLAALVGSGGLGRYVIDGFAVRDFAEVGAGVTLVVALVIVNELLFAGLARVASTGPRGARRDSAAYS